MGAKGPNHFGLEKWKKTMFSAAKARNPLSAGRRSLLADFATGLSVAEGKTATAPEDAGALGTICAWALRSGLLGEVAAAPNGLNPAPGRVSYGFSEFCAS